MSEARQAAENAHPSRLIGRKFRFPHELRNTIVQLNEVDMTSPMWQKSDDRPTFFPPPPLFEPEVRRTSAVTLPIRCETLPDEEPEILSWDDIVASEDEGAEFLAKVSDYITPVPMPNDVNMRFMVAYELISEAKKVLGTAGIRHFCDWLDHFDREIVA